MVDSRKTGVLSTILLALLLSCGSGCVLNEFVAIDGTGFVGVEGPCGAPCDPYYVPPCSDVYAVDPAFFGYHATCWTPWPEGWTGCPPSLTSPGTPAGAAGMAPPSLAKPGSVLDELQPPIPQSTDWDIVPSPDAAPPKVKAEQDMPFAPQQPIAPPQPKRMEPKPVERPSPFRVEAPAADEKPMEAPAEKRLDEDEALKPQPRKVIEAPASKAPAPKKPDAPAPKVLQAPASKPLDMPAPKAKAPKVQKPPAPKAMDLPAPKGLEAPVPSPLQSKKPAEKPAAAPAASAPKKPAPAPKADQSSRTTAPLPEDVFAYATTREPLRVEPPREMDRAESPVGLLPPAPLPGSVEAEPASVDRGGWVFCSDDEPAGAQDEHSPPEAGPSGDEDFSFDAGPVPQEGLLPAPMVLPTYCSRPTERADFAHRIPQAATEE